MKTIWKWTLTPDCTLDMPVGAKILDVQSQYDEPQLWALVDPSVEKEQRQFKTYGTGHIMSGENEEYIGTFQIHRGTLIFHVFECQAM